MKKLIAATSVMGALLTSQAVADDHNGTEWSFGTDAGYAAVEYGEVKRAEAVFTESSELDLARSIHNAGTDADLGALSDLMSGVSMVSGQYRVIQNQAHFGWLSQYSLDDSIHDFVGPEACMPTSATNGMTFMQNAYSFYFGDRLTGNSYEDWIATDTLLISEPYMDTAPQSGTSVNGFLRGVGKYLIGDNGFDLVSVNTMTGFRGVEAAYPGQDTVINEIPTWQFIQSSLAAGNVTVLNLFYPGMTGGHAVLVTGFEWDDANGDGIIQKSEGAILYAVDPLDPSETYPDGLPGGGAKFTEILIWNNPADGILLLDYFQYAGNLPYDPEKYILTEGDGVLAIYSIDTRRVQDFIASVSAAGFFFGDFPESASRDQLAYQLQLQRRAGIGLQTTPVGETDVWASAQGGEANIIRGDRQPRAAMVGLEHRVSESWILGGALRVDDSDSDWADAGELRRRDYKASVYGGYQQERLSVTGELTFGRLDYESTRRFAIGDETRSHTGDTQGDMVTGGIEIGYHLGEGVLSHGPFGRLSAQHIKVDAYTEDSSEGQQSTRLSVGSQRFDSLLGALGWQFVRSGTSWTLYGSVALNQEFDRESRNLLLTSWAGGEMTLSLDAPQKNFATLNLGAMNRFDNGIRLGLDLDLRHDSDRGTDRWVMASLTVPL